MRLNLAFVLLISSAVAELFQSDILAERGLDRLWLDVAENPESYSKTCTSETVAHRQEWYVPGNRQSPI
jgi:hypothetical protein